MIQLNNFSLHFEATANSHAQTIVSNLNLNINPGEIFVLMGENGVGKSAILHEILRQSFLPLHTTNARLPDTKGFLGQDIWESITVDPHSIHSDYYTIMWEFLLANSLSHPRMPALDEEEINNWYSVAVTEIDRHFESNLEKNLFDFGLSKGRLAESFDKLSPGTKKKLLISIMLATNPSAIIFDELTNHLDKDSVTLLTAKLKQSKSAILLVDHNSEFVDAISTNWIYIPNNKERIPFVFKGINYEAFMKEIGAINSNNDAVLKAVKNKEKALKKAHEMQKRRVEVYGVGIGATARGIASRIERDITNHSIHKQLTKSHSVQLVPSQKTNRKVKKDRLISIKSLEYNIGSSRTQTIENFKAYHGDRIRITGPNGSGKSTLINLISEQIQKISLSGNTQYITGEIDVNDELTSPNSFFLSQTTTYGKELMLYTYLGDVLQFQDYQIPGFLKRLSLDHYATNALLSSLSLGELTRLNFGILATTIHEKKLIILDEPGNFLDIFTQNTLISLLNQYTGTVIVITHDDRLAAKLCIDGEFDLR